MTEVTEDALARRLAALEQAGIVAWDEAGALLVRRLLDRGRDAPPAVAEHVYARAAHHLTKLERGFADARARAEATLARLSQLGVTRSEGWEDRLRAGELTALQRLGRRHPHDQPRTREGLQESRTAALLAQAKARGITASDDTVRSAETLAATLYRDALAGASARLAVVRAAASVPEDAGHYNPAHIAARTLEALSAYSPYLEAQLARLELMTWLRQLPDAGKPHGAGRGSRPRPRRTPL